MKNDSHPTWLVKDTFDVGLYTNELDRQFEFWQAQLSLSFEQAISIGGGVRQYRFEYQRAILKVNHSRNPLPTFDRGNILKLLIGSTSVSETQEFKDPDGNQFALVPQSKSQNFHWSVEIGVTSEKAFVEFYHGCLGLPKCSEELNSVWCGRSQIRGRVDARIASEEQKQPVEALGLRYLTFQVDKVDALHFALVSRGAIEVIKPTTLGATARVSFIRDWFGNSIELSQRASLVGTLEQ